MSPDCIAFFAKYIEKETGIIYADINLYQLKTRLEDFCKAENIPTGDELQKRFLSFPDLSLKQRLLDAATNNETLFFRDPTFFTALESFLLREVVLTMPDEIRIWSAAASTGQEALSVAMTLEELSTRVPIPPFSIVASDICEKALNKAKKGVYSDFEVMRGLSEERKQKFFTRKDDGWHVKPSLFSKISFTQNNLIRSQVNGPFHVILCRNVLIYQKVEMKKVIFESLLKQLDPTGAVLLGVGETLLGVKNDVETVMVGNVIFYREKKDSSKIFKIGG